MEIRQRKGELWEKKVFEERGEEEGEDVVRYKEGIVSVGGWQKPHNGGASMTSAGTWR